VLGGTIGTFRIAREDEPTHYFEISADWNGVATSYYSYTGRHQFSGTVYADSLHIQTGGFTDVDFTLPAEGQLKINTDVIVDKLIARQDGGVVGTDEVQIYHDGTRTIIETKSGDINFKAPYEGYFDFTTGGGNNHVIVYDLRTTLGLIQFVDYQTYLGYGGATGVTKVGSNQAGSSGGGTFCSVPQTPTQITSNQHDYVVPRARYYRLSTDASRDITGFSIGQVDGLECEIWNVGAFNIVLKHQDANSTAANRFICTGAADITLAADEIALLRYDSTTTRWRVRKV
jgi:hypothetical protein